MTLLLRAPGAEQRAGALRCCGSSPGTSARTTLHRKLQRVGSNGPANAGCNWSRYVPETKVSPASPATRTSPSRRSEPTRTPTSQGNGSNEQIRSSASPVQVAWAQQVLNFRARTADNHARLTGEVGAVVGVLPAGTAPRTLPVAQAIETAPATAQGTHKRSSVCRKVSCGVSCTSSRSFAG